MKYFVLKCLLLWSCSYCFAQDYYFSGQVKIDNQEAAIGAYVFLENTEFQTITDFDGNFSLGNIPAGSYRLKVSYVGTTTYQAELSFPKDKGEHFINLKSTQTLLGAVTVSAKTESRQQQEQAIEIESIELRALVSQIKDISEAIDQLSGVRVRSSGSFGDRADVSINGLNGTAVRTYIDGLPLDFVYPQFSFNNLPIDNIKRVDIYKGVVPIEVGTDALGGGINVITQEKPYNEIKASYGYGSFNTHQASTSVNLALSEDLTININGTYNASDNNYKMNALVWETKEEQEIRRFHDDYKFAFFGAAFELRNKPWADKFRFSLNYGTYDKAIQHGGRIGNIPFGAANYQGNALATMLKYEKAIGSAVKLATLFAFSDNNIIFSDTTANIYSWSGNIITRNENRPGEFGDASLSDRNFKNAINRVNLSYELSLQDELSISNLVAYQNTVGRDEVKPIERDFLVYNQYLTKDILGLQYQRKMWQNKFIFALAGKAYFYQTQGIERRSSSKIEKIGKRLGYYASLKYTISDQFFLRSSYESALRIPTFNQFFGNGAAIISNVELQPESSDNTNVGFVYRSKKLGFFKFGIEANGFLRQQNDIIYLTLGQFQQYKNAEEVRTIGIEGDVFFNFWDKLNLNVNATRLKQTYESISEANQTAQFLVGTAFPNVPSFFTNARLTYMLSNLFNFTNKLRFYAQHRFVDEFNYINVGRVYDANNYVPTQHRFDVGFTYTGWDNTITLGFNINNLLDAANFDNFSIPRPGRSFSVKMTYRLLDF